MDRNKMRQQLQNLRNKRLKPRVQRIRIKPKVVKKVLKVESFSTKQTTTKVAANRPTTKQVLQEARVKRVKSTGGCPGCRRRLGR